MKHLTAVTFAVAALAGLTLLAKGFPEGSPPFVTSYRSVTEAAKKSGKPMVVVFSSVDCPPCMAMKKAVYPSKEVDALHDKFEWAYLDLDDRENSKVADKFEVDIIPHIEFIGADGKSIAKQVGGVLVAKDFAAILKDVLSKAVPKS